MKLFPVRLAGVISGAILFGMVSTAQAATNPPAHPSAVTNRVWVVQPVEIPQSLFAAPASPKEGRNPFFPKLIAPPPPGPDRSVPPPPVDTSAFILNGITSPPKRTAMINGRTFEVGEEGEVRLPNGAREMIKCEAIKGESAVILIHGERKELRLRSGL